MQPRAVVLDVNETLSDLSPLGEAFERAGLPGALAPTWFASVLRDGFALAAVGESATFREIGAALLRSYLHDAGESGTVDERVSGVLGAFTDLSLHPDVAGGLRRLADSGLRVVTLSNGAVEVADRLLTRGGVRDAVEQLLSVERAGIWKPAAAAYRYAADALGEPVDHLLMVAVHPWDLHGAARAGLRTAWVDRRGGSPYPGYVAAPDLVVRGFDELADRLTG